MIRLLSVFILVVLSAPVVAQSPAVPSQAAPLSAEQKPSVSAMCVYGSKTYSEGAYVCVKKSLMLTCTSDGAKTTWTVVADKDLGNRCASPPAVRVSASVQRARWNRRNIRREIYPPTDSSPYCFNFDGRRYCE